MFVTLLHRRLTILIIRTGFSRDIANSQKKWKGTPNGDLLTDQAAEYIAGISFEGGADTSRYTLQGFVKVNATCFICLLNLSNRLQVMALFPDIQVQAQKEIDDIVGSTELPSAKHFNHLPYTRGTMKESLRCTYTVFLVKSTLF